MLAAITNQIPEDHKHDSNYYIYVRLEYLSLITLLHSFTQPLAWWRAKDNNLVFLYSSALLRAKNTCIVCIMCQQYGFFLLIGMVKSKW